MRHQKLIRKKLLNHLRIGYTHGFHSFKVPRNYTKNVESKLLPRGE